MVISVVKFGQIINDLGVVPKLLVSSSYLFDLGGISIMTDRNNLHARQFRPLLGAILLTAAAVTLYGQTGSIAGTITDPSGAGVPAATVTVKSIETAAVRTASTDNAGTYSLPNVAVGHYDVTVEKSGFSTLRFQDIQLTVAQSLTLNGNLTVGVVSQAIEVQGSTVPILNFADAQLSNIVDQKRIVDLPLITRDPYQLVLLSPGVLQTSSSMGGFSVNGQRERNNNFLLDGTDNNDASVPEALYRAE